MNILSYIQVLLRRSQPIHNLSSVDGRYRVRSGKCGRRLGGRWRHLRGGRIGLLSEQTVPRGRKVPLPQVRLQLLLRVGDKIAVVLLVQFAEISMRGKPRFLAHSFSIIKKRTMLCAVLP